MDQHLLDFLRSQRAMAVASVDEKPWITNVFYGVDDNLMIYFISNEKTIHSQQILNNPHVAFSVVWFNPKNHKDRVGVQGQGTCSIATDDAHISKGVELHNKLYPEFANRITVDWVKSTDNLSHVWIIKPSRIKFWNDGLYGQDESKEFTFSH
jgi:uncharacterized protein YhbP (UPF0306 family)